MPREKVDETMKLIPTCEDLSRAVADGAYADGPDRWRLRLHMICCWVCRRYAAQLRWIDKASKIALASGAASDADFKRRLVGRLGP
jgi:hypothetical protein